MKSKMLVLLVCVVGAIWASGAVAAETKMVLPLGRTVYQTNESIPLAVTRASNDALQAGKLELTVTGNDGSQMAFTLPASAVAAGEGGARATEHVNLNARLMRPGHYLVEASVDGALGTAEIDVYNHVRRTSFRLINWGRARDKDQLAQGEDSIGFNLFCGHYGRNERLIEAGVDYMPCCTMSGGHQMDLRMECDWSDPYVARGGTVRVVRQGLADRLMSNTIGVHFYDEPGLTWHTDPVTGETTPHMIPSQVRSYVAAFGREPLHYSKVDPRNQDDVRQWRQWARWKLGFMDAAWKEAQFGVSYVDPRFLSATQSQYGFSAYADGYYFNVARCLPVVSGHGGYDDYGAAYFNPSYTLEMARARDLAKPCWYLPTWYGNTPPDRFRMEQYMSFQTNIQGMMSPPDLEPGGGKSAGMEGIVESNKLMGRLGTVFTTMPVTRPPVAMLYSLSNMLDAQTKNMTLNYAHATRHGLKLPFLYLASKQLQQQFLVVVEEDVLDGTLAANHKAIILTGIDYLDPDVVAALEKFAARGNLVLMTSDCTVKIAGAINLGVTPEMPDAEQIAELRKNAEANKEKLAPLTTLGKQLQGAQPLAKAIKAQLDKAGIKPVFECDNSGIVATRQAAGDVEYLFAVNAAFDYQVNTWNAMAPMAQAEITVDAAGRPAYDAVRGGAVAELKKKGKSLTGTLRFGPGQMRVFALTARPIGSVKTAAPVLVRDYTLTDSPITVHVAASVLDDKGGLLSGSIPLQVSVIDPLGKTRHEVYRATRQGVLQTSLPLAANDPAGEWKVVARELLNNTEDTATFALAKIDECAALAGETPRAVSFGRDIENIFRFARVNQDVTIVTGGAEFNNSAAERIQRSLLPLDVRCKIVPATEVNKAREIPAEARGTWTGLAFGRLPEQPSIGHTGFALQGPAILLGTPEDNPLIKYLADQSFLPFKPAKDAFPGRGRGMIAWQRDGIGHGQESITLIAYDEQGMSEAAGTLYEAATGMEPLTPWTLPSASSLSPAMKTPDTYPAAKLVWEVVLPDKAVAMRGEGNQVVVLTKDGTQATLTTGRNEPKVSQKTVKPAEIEALMDLMVKPDAAGMEAAKKYARADRLLKMAVSGNGMTAVGFWGGTLRIAVGEQLAFEQNLGQDICGLAWAGDVLVAALADGRVVGLSVMPQ